MIQRFVNSWFSVLPRNGDVHGLEACSALLSSRFLNLLDTFENFFRLCEEENPQISLQSKHAIVLDWLDDVLDVVRLLILESLLDLPRSLLRLVDCSWEHRIVQLWKVSGTGVDEIAQILGLALAKRKMNAMRLHLWKDLTLTSYASHHGILWDSPGLIPPWLRVDFARRACCIPQDMRLSKAIHLA